MQVMVLHSAVLCRACSSSDVPVAVGLLKTQGPIECLQRRKVQEPRDKPIRHLSKTSVAPFQNSTGSLIICHTRFLNINLLCLLSYSSPASCVIKWCVKETILTKMGTRERTQTWKCTIFMSCTYLSVCLPLSPSLVSVVSSTLWTLTGFRQTEEKFAWNVYYYFFH
jgi:hypothetical protein